jgi:hypothetical protein
VKSLYSVAYHYYDHDGVERSTCHSHHQRFQGAMVELAELVYNDYGRTLEGDAEHFTVPDSERGAFYDIEAVEVYE